MLEQNHSADPRIVAWLQNQKASRYAVDFGAGVGVYTRHIRTERVVALDQHAPFLKRCHENGVRETVCGSMVDWQQLGLGEFDTAVFIDSIEHVRWDHAHTILVSLQDAPHIERILVFAPHGEHPQEDHEATLYEHHFESLGFYVTVDPDFHVTREIARAAMYGVWWR